MLGVSPCSKWPLKRADTILYPVILTSSEMISLEAEADPEGQGFIPNTIPTSDALQWSQWLSLCF